MVVDVIVTGVMMMVIVDVNVTNMMRAMRRSGMVRRMVRGRRRMVGGRGRMVRRRRKMVRRRGRMVRRRAKAVDVIATSVDFSRRSGRKGGKDESNENF